MFPGCDQVLPAISVLLGKHPTDAILTIEDVEVAFLHVRRCPACRGTLTSEEHGNFVSRVLLERE